MLDSVLVANHRLAAGELIAEGNQLAPVRGPERAAGESEVEGPSRLVLAGAVGPIRLTNPLPQLYPARRQAAQRLASTGGDQHRRTP